MTNLDKLIKHNTELEITIADLKIDNKVLMQRNNELGERLHKKEKEIQTIKNTIQTMMDNERTHLGYNVLNQLWEAIQ